MGQCTRLYRKHFISSDFESSLSPVYTCNHFVQDLGLSHRYVDTSGNLTLDGLMKVANNHVVYLMVGENYHPFTIYIYLHI